jgi:hypothetical protein
MVFGPDSLRLANQYDGALHSGTIVVPVNLGQFLVRTASCDSRTRPHNDVISGRSCAISMLSRWASEPPRT